MNHQENRIKSQVKVGDWVRWVETDDPVINEHRRKYGTGPFPVIEVRGPDPQKVRLLVHLFADGSLQTVRLLVPANMLDKTEIPPVELFAVGDKVYLRKLPEEQECRDENGWSLADQCGGSGPFNVAAVEWNKSSSPARPIHPQWVKLGSDFQISGFFLTKVRPSVLSAPKRHYDASRMVARKRYSLGWWVWQMAARTLSVFWLTVGIAGGKILADYTFPGVAWFAWISIFGLAIVSLVPVLFCWIFCETRAEQYEYYDYRLPK